MGTLEDAIAKMQAEAKTAVQSGKITQVERPKPTQYIPSASKHSIKIVSDQTGDYVNCIKLSCGISVEACSHCKTHMGIVNREVRCDFDGRVENWMVDRDDAQTEEF